jgi:hypothetical protein
MPTSSDRIPGSQWSKELDTHAFFAYADNYLIDVKFGIWREFITNI